MRAANRRNGRAAWGSGAVDAPAAAKMISAASAQRWLAPSPDWGMERVPRAA